MMIRTLSALVLLLAVNIFQGCDRPDLVEKNWDKVSVGMDATNVVALLGYPYEVIDDSTDVNWFYSPKRDIPHARTSDLVIDCCVVRIISNKVVKTYVCYVSKNERISR